MPPKQKRKRSVIVEADKTADDGNDFESDEMDSDDPESEQEEEDGGNGEDEGNDYDDEDEYVDFEDNDDEDEEEEDDDNNEEEEDDDNEEEEDGDNEEEGDDDEVEEEEEEEENEVVKVEPVIVESPPSPIPNEKESNIVTMDYCAKHHYQGSLGDIKNMLNGLPMDEFELEVERPEHDGNECVFKDVNKKWGWKQEIALLEGIEIHGLFRWQKVADRVMQATNRKISAKECHDHYFQYYFNGTLGQVWDYRLSDTYVKHFDHTEYDPVDACGSHKYLPAVSGQNLKEIQFLPHREAFETYPKCNTEKMVTKLDFSSYYLDLLSQFKIDQEVRELQLLIIDTYRMEVADRIKLYNVMRDFKLIEQFFNMDSKKIVRKCEVEKLFYRLQKFIKFYDSPDEFIEFFFDCLKEKLLKYEIARLYKALTTRKLQARGPDMKVMLKKRAPSFLDVGLLLNADKDFILHKSKKRKKKFKFTKRKRTR